MTSALCFMPYMKALSFKFLIFGTHNVEVSSLCYMTVKVIIDNDDLSLRT